MSRKSLTTISAAALWAILRASASGQVTLTKNSDLVFGSLIAGATAGTIVISPAGAVSASGGVTLVPSTTSAAAFRLSNPASGTARIYFLQLPATVTLTSGADSMTVNAFTDNIANLGVIAAGANLLLDVGATLNVGANQPSGTYTATFPVTFFLF